MKTQEFQFLNRMIKQRSGIDLKEDKMYLFESRLLPIASKEGHKDLSSFVSQLMKRSPPEALTQSIIEAMTTNESMFFRDNKPFEHLRYIVLAELKEKHGAARPINIWCAACSSGQEPYSIAMHTEEYQSHIGLARVTIKATDIDTQMVDKAKNGIYNQFEVQRGLPTPMLMRYFNQLPGNRWQIKDTIRGKVSFSLHNLMESPRRHGQFDIVLCRNVLIYFDDATKIQVLRHIASVMPSGGYLFLGSAETMPNGMNLFDRHPKERLIFVKR